MAEIRGEMQGGGVFLPTPHDLAGKGGQLPPLGFCWNDAPAFELYKIKKILLKNLHFWEIHEKLFFVNPLRNFMELIIMKIYQKYIHFFVTMYVKFQKNQYIIFRIMNVERVSWLFQELKDFDLAG